MSFALAKAISAVEGRNVDAPKVRIEVAELTNEIPAEKLRRKRKPNFKRKANFLVPSKEVRGTRCELFVGGFSNEQVEMHGCKFPAPIWRSELVLGEGTDSTKRFGIDDEMHSLLWKRLRPAFPKQIDALLDEWDIVLRDYESAAAVFCSYVLERKDQSPLALMDAALDITDRNLPSHPHHNTHIDCSRFIHHPKSRRLKIRVLAGCLMAHQAISKWHRKREEDLLRAEA